MDIKAKAFVPSGTKITPNEPPVVRIQAIDLSDDHPEEEAGPSSPRTKEIGVGTAEVFPIKPIICLKPSATTQTVESNHTPTKGPVYLIWDYSTIPYNTKRNREVKKFGMKYGKIETIYVCGLDDIGWNEKKKLKGPRQVIESMQSSCMDVPFCLNDGAYTPYEQVITKASEVIDEHLYFRHVCNACAKGHWQQLILMIISDDRRFVRYLNRRWKVKSFTLGLIVTDKSILENAVMLETHVIT